MIRRILCLGDSNTYGTNPVGPRFDEATRWPCVLEDLLGANYRVVEEGFGGRTIAFDDPVEGGYKSAMLYAPPCLMSHNPLDLVVVMLGTNDTKQRFQMSAGAIAQSLMHLLRLCRLYALDANGHSARLLVVVPPPVRIGVLDTPMEGAFDARSVEVSQALAPHYERAARLMRCAFFDAAGVCQASDEDSVHLTAAGHLALARALKDKIYQVFEGD